MNSVNLCGKIHKITNFGTVSFVTVHCRDSRNSEFLDVTVFDNKFLNRYFTTGSWIGVHGRIHKNAKQGYKQEIIADNLYFVGDAPPVGDAPTTEYDVDPETGEIINNPTPQPPKNVVWHDTPPRTS